MRPLKTVAQLMADLDSGALPVGENDLLIGVITDHDITVRAVVKGRDPEKGRPDREPRAANRFRKLARLA